jgi:hypothetical protein
MCRRFDPASVHFFWGAVTHSVTNRRIPTRLVFIGVVKSAGVSAQAPTPVPINPWRELPCAIRAVNPEPPF